MKEMTMEEFRKHKAYIYAKDVVDGKEIAGIYIIKQCESFLDMVDNQENRLYKNYYINLKMVKKVDGLVRLMNFATGEKAGQSVGDNLEGFQSFIIINLYCVFHRDKPKKRRFEKACVFIARKNAKTVLVSVFMILALLLEPNYTQLVASANSKDQAKILFKEIIKILEVSPKIKKYFKILSSEIKCKLNDNSLIPIAAEARTTDGMLVGIGCVDEYGASRDTSIYDSLQTSMLSTLNRLLFTISTGYPYPNNPMKEQIQYGKRVLDGAIEDDKFFLMCYELDEKDLWTDEKVWIKSNPLQAKSELGMDFLRSELKMALELPSKQLAFRTKNLNQWLDGGDKETYISVDDWQKCKVDNYDWYGREVYLGVDLSLTTDNTAVAMITYDHDLEKFVSKVWGFIPTDRVEIKSKEEKIPYRQFIKNGNCFDCGDRVISHKVVEDFVLNLENKYGVKIKTIGYDRYNAISSANRWYECGYDTKEIKQHSSVLSAPTKRLQELILQEKFLYEKNRLLEINVGNAMVTYDTNLNKYINKKKSNGKIDLLVAIINAMQMWVDDEDNGYLDLGKYDGIDLLI